MGSRVRGWLSKRTSQALSRVDLGGRLLHIERRLADLEYFSHGARATYLGNNRLLVRSVIARWNLVFIVEADDKLITPWFAATGLYETALTDFLVRELKRDSHCLDLGSNFGFFACLMGRACPQGKVIAVEADKKLQEMARDNLAANGFLENATALHAAVSDSNADVTLYRRTFRSANTSIINAGEDFTERLGEPPVEPFQVPGIRIDDLAERLGGRVDFIKIDIEGAEPLAFAGAARTIAENPGVTIIMEWSPGQIAGGGTSPEAFLATLQGMGLSLWEIVEGGVRPMTAEQLLGIPYLAGVVLRRGA